LFPDHNTISAGQGRGSGSRPPHSSRRFQLSGQSGQAPELQRTASAASHASNGSAESRIGLFGFDPLDYQDVGGEEEAVEFVNWPAQSEGTSAQDLFTFGGTTGAEGQTDFVPETLDTAPSGFFGFGSAPSSAGFSFGGSGLQLSTLPSGGGFQFVPRDPALTVPGWVAANGQSGFPMPPNIGAAAIRREFARTAATNAAINAATPTERLPADDSAAGFDRHRFGRPRQAAEQAEADAEAVEFLEAANDVTADWEDDDSVADITGAEENQCAQAFRSQSPSTSPYASPSLTMRDPGGQPEAWLYHDSNSEGSGSSSDSDHDGSDGEGEREYEDVDAMEHDDDEDGDDDEENEGESSGDEHTVSDSSDSGSSRGSDPRTPRDVRRRRREAEASLFEESGTPRMPTCAKCHLQLSRHPPGTWGECCVVFL